MMADDDTFKRADPHEPCVPDYRGPQCDPATGRILDPFKLRDKRNAHTNPKSKGGLDHDASDRFFGID